MNRAELIKIIKHEVCGMIGCSMMDENCPGNSDCEIVLNLLNTGKATVELDNVLIPETKGYYGQAIREIRKK